jgi:hypothetical protein
MGWNTVFLVLGIIAGILGIWNLARQRNIFLSLTGVLWFLVVLFWFFIKDVYNYVLVSGVPVVGELVMFLIIPICIILAFFTGYRR